MRFDSNTPGEMKSIRVNLLFVIRPALQSHVEALSFMALARKSHANSSTKLSRTVGSMNQSGGTGLSDTHRLLSGMRFLLSFQCSHIDVFWMFSDALQDHMPVVYIFIYPMLNRSRQLLLKFTGQLSSKLALRCLVIFRTVGDT